MKLQHQCTVCNKKAEAISEARVFNSILITLKCGHLTYQEVIQKDRIKQRDEKWRLARDYQKIGVEFIEDSNFNCLLADEMRLGKTVQALLAIRYNLENLTPVLFVVKSALKFQWAQEILTWIGYRAINMPVIINNGKMGLLPGFNFYIISMDTLKPQLENLKAKNFKLLIVDESHHFKDTRTNRCKAIIDLVSPSLNDNFIWGSENREKKEYEGIPHRICLSGTPILNRASEYFTTLNLIKPEYWHNQTAFERKWIDRDYETGKLGGINCYKQEEFEEITKKYILRRMRADVFTELPELTRNMEIVESDNELFKKEYKKGQSDLKELLYNSQKSGFETNAALITILTRLRQLVGLAKVPFIIDEVEEFFNSISNSETILTNNASQMSNTALEIGADFEEITINTTRKLVIGIHHKIVSALLLEKLKPYNPIIYDGDLTPEAKLSIEKRFKNDNSCKIMIASVLAAGEGLDLHYCSDIIFAERQWNRPKELQFEDRFKDPVKQKNKINITYLHLKNSLDEWLSELIDEKWEYTGTAISQEEYRPEREINFRELAEKTALQVI